MAKAILEYNLKDPEDVIAHKRAGASLDMAIVLFEITVNLKKKIINKNVDEYYNQGVEAVFDEIYNLMDEHNINIDEILE